jgi:hypothetical protein
MTNWGSYATDLSINQRTCALQELGYQLDKQGQWTEAEYFYREALDDFKRQQDQSGQATTYTNLVVMLRFQVEQNEAASERLEGAMPYHQIGIGARQTVKRSLTLYSGGLLA